MILIDKRNEKHKIRRTDLIPYYAKSGLSIIITPPETDLANVSNHSITAHTSSTQISQFLQKNNGNDPCVQLH